MDEWEMKSRRIEEELAEAKVDLAQRDDCLECKRKSGAYKVYILYIYCFNANANGCR